MAQNAAKKTEDNTLLVLKTAFAENREANNAALDSTLRRSTVLYNKNSLLRSLLEQGLSRDEIKQRLSAYDEFTSPDIASA
jgi:hypothetical protein